ncbi:MAG: hypothetical protein EOO40_07920, partial [Deltaproteobacteria bacterium]
MSHGVNSQASILLRKAQLEAQHNEAQAKVDKEAKTGSKPPPDDYQAANEASRNKFLAEDNSKRVQGHSSAA